eukprot:12431504-Karenia_brevis.AAC.2
MEVPRLEEDFVSLLADYKFLQGVLTRCQTVLAQRSRNLVSDDEAFVVLERELEPSTASDSDENSEGNSDSDENSERAPIGRQWTDDTLLSDLVRYT